MLSLLIFVYEEGNIRHHPTNHPSVTLDFIIFKSFIIRCVYK